MSAIKRELERVAEVLLTGDYEATLKELTNLEELGADAGIYAHAIDMAKAMAPLCSCGSDYFEGLRGVTDD